MDRLFRSDHPDLPTERGAIIRIPGDPEPRVVATIGVDGNGAYVDVLTGYDGYVLVCEVAGSQPIDEMAFAEWRAGR